MSDKINIKPCPFCGGEIFSILPSRIDEEGHIYRGSIECPFCEIIMYGPRRLFYGRPTDQELKAMDGRLLKKWNRREAENE